MDGRKRTVQIKFRVTEEEHRIIEQRMKLVPTRNMAAYCLIGKAPCADQAQGFGKLRKGRPKKKCAVPFCKFGNGKRT